jgi:hypothetical protein
MLACRPDAAGEHQVKLLGFCDIVVSVWIAYVMLAT